MRIGSDRARLINYRRQRRAIKDKSEVARKAKGRNLSKGRGSVATHIVFGCTLRHGAQALLVSCGLDRLSHGSGWRSYLYPFISSAPARSRLAAHARPGPAGDSDIPERGVPVPPLHGYLHTFIPPARYPSHLYPTSLRCVRECLRLRT